MDPEDNALDDFKANLDTDFPTQEELDNDGSDPLDPKEPRTEEQEEVSGHKNREHRRTSQRLERERQSLQEIREANIKEAGRLEALSEQRKFLEGLPSQAIDERLITLYGDNENGRKAAQITQSLLEDTAKRARQDALEDFQNQSREREREVRQNNEFIDSELESLEDQSGIDLTSNAPAARKARAEFLDMVEKFSSKDEDGDIRDYADFSEVFSVYRKTRVAGNQANKNLASRGMARGGTTTQNLADKMTERALIERGLI